jgi:tRNA pseudouridine55 synthase
MQINGFVNINKAAGVSSSGVVVKVRGCLSKLLGERQKVGHLGTLDPEAEGVLPVALGTATKLFDFSQNKTKEYAAKFVFGKTTDTLDRAGTITAQGGRVPTAQEIAEVLPKFIGEIEQVPPKFSAKSVGGRRAYDLARRGESVELPAKKITVYDFRLLGEEDGAYKFRIVCGSGCYIRALARDIADALGTAAYMSQLCRVKSGAFGIENAVTLERFVSDPMPHILPVEYMLSELPRYDLPQTDAQKILNGVKIKQQLPSGYFRVYNNGGLVGLGEDDGGFLKLIRL